LTNLFSLASLLLFYLSLTVEQPVSVSRDDIESQDVINSVREINREELSNGHRFSRYNLENFSGDMATSKFYISF